MGRCPIKLFALVAGCALSWPALPARADDLPPPVVRPSVRRPVTAPAPRPSAVPTRTTRSPARTDRLPYGLPGYTSRRQLLPVSGPSRTATRRTSVPPAPVARAPRRSPSSFVPTGPRRASPRATSALPPPTVRAALPVWAPRSAPAAAGRRGISARAPRSARVTSTPPRRRTVARRAVPRRVPARGRDLVVPCVPNQPPPCVPKPRRCRLPFLPPLGCEDG